MTKYLFTTILLFFICFQTNIAQYSYFEADDSLSIVKNDTILFIESGLREEIINWEKSSDLINWETISNNLSNDTLLYKANSLVYIRFALKEGTCDTIYSDTIRIDTTSNLISLLDSGITISEMLDADLLSDLISQGIDISLLFNNDVGVGTLEQNGISASELEAKGLIGTVSDIEDNTYKWVKIGSQIWMSENLRTTRYNDSSLIPLVEINQPWTSLTTGAYTNIYDDDNNSATYGRYYNYYAATNVKGICPTTWHVPTHDDYLELINTLGGFSEADNKLKAIYSQDITYNWGQPNDATNCSGFNALPAAYKDSDDFHHFLTYDAMFWSQTGINTSLYYVLFLRDDLSDAILYHLSIGYENYGLSIRCIKD